MRAVYANCFVPNFPAGATLLTDEFAVAREQRTADGSPVVGEILDERIDSALAHQVSCQMWDLANSWFSDQERDWSQVAGVSAGDLAAAEVALTVLLPAARGVLEAQALSRLEQLESLHCRFVETGPGNYATVERMQATAFAAAVRLAVPGCQIEVSPVHDSGGNQALFAKYERTRDPDWLVPQRSGRRRLVQAVLNAVSNVRSLRRCGGSLFVYEYNPTRAFAQSYESRTLRRRMVRYRSPVAEMPGIAWLGDRVLLPVPAPIVQEMPSLRVDLRAQAKRSAEAGRFTVSGVDLAGVVSEQLVRVTERYSAFAASAAPVFRRELRLAKVRAVLLAFDGSPEARLLMRVAQALGVPTFVVNDGYKCDGIQREGLSADIALAWSDALANGYFARRTHGRVAVTGNPKADAQLAARVARRSAGEGCILVGSFTYSPLDLNCRRSDPERFIEEVLHGIQLSCAARRRIVVKLHPADNAEHYAAVLELFPDLDIEIVSDGDVVEMFSDAALYITTYSTSLLEAAAHNVAFVYYRVNDQQMFEPFEGDERMLKRTAGSSDDLARLIDDPPAPDQQESVRAWLEHYLGPAGNSVELIAAEIERELVA